MKTGNQLQLVTFEQAERLNKAGFNWNTGKMYWSAGTGIQKPTVALALKWFRDVKRMNTGILPSIDEKHFTLMPANGAYKTNLEDNVGKYFDTYEQAESALLDGLLNLIQ